MRQHSQVIKPRIPIGIYSEDGEQGWNFNAQVKLHDATVSDIYEAAIELVSKQMLNKNEQKQRELDFRSGQQNDFDLIGGNKILLFQQKEIDLKLLHEQGQINS